MAEPMPFEPSDEEYDSINNEVFAQRRARRTARQAAAEAALPAAPEPTPPVVAYPVVMAEEALPPVPAPVAAEAAPPAAPVAPPEPPPAAPPMERPPRAVEAAPLPTAPEPEPVVTTPVGRRHWLGSAWDFLKSGASAIAGGIRAVGGAAERGVRALDRAPSAVWEGTKSVAGFVFSWNCAKMLVGATGSITGVRAFWKVPQYLMEKARVSREKSLISATLTGLACELEDLSRSRAREGGRDQTMAGLQRKRDDLQERIDENPSLSYAEKQELTARLNAVVDRYAGETEFAGNRFAKEFADILDDHIQSKVSGIDVAKEVLNTSFMATGLLMFRGISYAGLAVADRINRTLKQYDREHRDEAERGWTKSGSLALRSMLDSIPETWHALRGRGITGAETDPAKINAARLKAIGNIIRFVGIGGTAIALEYGHLNPHDQIEKLLDVVQKKGVVRASYDNWQEHMAKMVEAARSAGGFASGAYERARGWITTDEGAAPGIPGQPAAPAEVIETDATPPRPPVAPAAPPRPELGAPRPTPQEHVHTLARPPGGAASPGTVVEVVPAAGAQAHPLFELIKARVEGSKVTIPLKGPSQENTLYRALRVVIVDRVGGKGLELAKPDTLSALEAGRIENMEGNLIDRLLQGRGAGGLTPEKLNAVLEWNKKTGELVIKDVGKFESDILKPLWEHAKNAVPPSFVQDPDSAVGYAGKLSKEWKELLELRAGAAGGTRITLDESGFPKVAPRAPTVAHDELAAGEDVPEDKALHERAAAALRQAAEEAEYPPVRLEDTERATGRLGRLGRIAGRLKKIADDLEERPSIPLSDAERNVSADAVSLAEETRHITEPGLASAFANLSTQNMPAVQHAIQYLLDEDTSSGEKVKMLIEHLKNSGDGIYKMDTGNYGAVSIIKKAGRYFLRADEINNKKPLVLTAGAIEEFMKAKKALDDIREV